MIERRQPRLEFSNIRIARVLLGLDQNKAGHSFDPHRALFGSPSLPHTPVGRALGREPYTKELGRLGFCKCPHNFLPVCHDSVTKVQGSTIGGSWRHDALTRLLGPLVVHFGAAAIVVYPR
jgi:hypothetical protein